MWNCVKMPWRNPERSRRLLSRGSVPPSTHPRTVIPRSQGVLLLLIFLSRAFHILPECFGVCANFSGCFPFNLPSSPLSCMCCCVACYYIFPIIMLSLGVQVLYPHVMLSLTIGRVGPFIHSGFLLPSFGVNVFVGIYSLTAALIACSVLFAIPWTDSPLRTS